MKAVLAIAGAGALVAGGVHVSGVLRRGEVYAKPFAVAYAELAATPIPPMISGMFPGALPRIVQGPDSIEWHFGDDAHGSATFTAFLSSEDRAHTRVAVDVQVDKGQGTIAGPYLSSPLMLNIGRQAMAEQVAAELEDRAFDKMRYGQRMSVYMGTHPEDLQAYGQLVQGTMNDIATQVNGYPSKGSRNYRPPMSETLGAFGDLSGQMNAKVIRDAESWSSIKSRAMADTTTPLDPEMTRYQATHPATDLSTYR